MSATSQHRDICSTFHRLDRRVPALLIEPRIPEEKCRVGIVLMHSDEDYFSFVPGPELARRGYRVLAANVRDKRADLDEKLLDVDAAVRFLKAVPGVEAVVLLGHSGGATLMTAYQNVAENGAQVFQGPEKIIKCSDKANGLTPADGIMLLDSNYGNGAMTLFSLDPAVLDETSGLKLDPALDLYNPANGYDPNGSTYRDDFVKKFLKAQGERGNRLIAAAQERIALIDAGKGSFLDDEPFIVPSGAQFAPCNKLFPQDIRFLSRTSGAHPHIRWDGSITVEVVHCRRKPWDGRNMTGIFGFSSLTTTVRNYLKASAVRTTEEFGYDESRIYGIDWTSSYCCPPGSVIGITAPLLTMGMTGSYEYLAAEIIYENATSADKSIAFVEGAGHNFVVEPGVEDEPGQYGDTTKRTFDHVDGWLAERYL